MGRSPWHSSYHKVQFIFHSFLNLKNYILQNIITADLISKHLAGIEYRDKQSSYKGGNLFPKLNVRGGAYSEPWAVRALMIIDYRSRGPKTTFIFVCPLPFLRLFKEIECLKGRGHKR